MLHDQVTAGGSYGGELRRRDDPQADVSGHLVGPVPFPQLKLLWVGGVLHQAGQHHLAHELILHCVTVPDLRKRPISHVWLCSNCCPDNGSRGPQQFIFSF